MSQVVSVREETGRRRVQTENLEESKTVQSDRHRADIREILSKYQNTGIIDHMRNVDLQFRDVSEFEDFADLMRQTKVAEQEFMKLPSKLREVFHHDVNEWLDAAHDPDRLERIRPKLVELGLLEEEPHQNRTADGRFATGSHAHSGHQDPEASPSSSGEVEES